MPANPIHLTNISRPTDKVIGRDAQLKQIRKRLAEDNSVILVNGLGGIGKTTVALEFIHRYGSDYRHLAWIEVTDSITAAFVANRTLIDNLYLSAVLENLPKEDYEVLALERIINRLSNLDNCLLVIDNANDHDDLLACGHMLRTLRATTLLTSRAHPEDWNTVPIDELEPKDAAALFQRHFLAGVQPEQMDTLWELLRCLDHHTLLVELTAKAATKARLPLTALYDKVKANYLHDEKLNERTVSAGAHADHTKLPKQERVENYIQMVFQQISGLNDTEQRYLRYMCLLPSNAYEESFLQEVFQIDADTKPECLDTLESLAAKGWLTQKRDERGYTYKLHALVQDVAIRELKISYELCAAVVDYWIAALQIDPNEDNPVLKFPLLVFGEELVKMFKQEVNDKISLLFDIVGWIQSEKGHYLKALQLRKRALEINLQLFDKHDEHILVRQSNLATVYIKMGRYDEAEEILNEVLNSSIEKYGDQHSKLDSIYSNLALVLYEKSNYEKAKLFLEKALQIDIKHYGDRDIRVANRLSSIGVLYRALKDPENAKGLLKKSLEILQDLLFETDPKISICKSNLALAHRDLGELSEAKRLLEQALENDIINYGELDRRVANRYHNLAWILIDQNDLLSAYSLLEKAYKIWLQALGKEHPDTHNCAKSLAYVQEQLNQSGGT